MTPVTLAELDPRSRALALQQIGDSEGATALATVQKETFLTLGDPSLMSDDQLADIVIGGFKKMRQYLPYILAMKGRFDTGERDSKNRLKVPIKGCRSWIEFCSGCLQRTPQTIGELTTEAQGIQSVCPECNQSFPSKNKLRKHHQRDHLPQNPASEKHDGSANRKPTEHPSWQTPAVKEVVDWIDARVADGAGSCGFGNQNVKIAVRPEGVDNKKVKLHLGFVEPSLATSVLEFIQRSRRVQVPDAQPLPDAEFIDAPQPAESPATLAGDAQSTPVEPVNNWKPEAIDDCMPVYTRASETPDMCAVCIEHPHKMTERPFDYSMHPELQTQTASRSHGMGLERLRKLASELNIACAIKYDDGFKITCTYSFASEAEAKNWLQTQPK